jgi:hypothetical protein
MATISSTFLPPRAVWLGRAYVLRRDAGFVPQRPRARGPAGPGTATLRRRVFREPAGRG